MGHITEIKKILTDTLGLGDRLNGMGPDMILLGNIPELDSVAVVTVILAIEKKFSIAIKDDEISGSSFEKFLIYSLVTTLFSVFKYR